MAAEVRCGADRARLEIAAAIRAGAGERPFGAGGAEGAFEAADARVGAVGRQVPAASFAIRSELKHIAVPVVGANGGGGLKGSIGANPSMA